jgi:hypothetical protein
MLWTLEGLGLKVAAVLTLSFLVGASLYAGWVLRRSGGLADQGRGKGRA